MTNFDVNVFIITRENSCKIGRAPYGVRLIFYNAGRAPYDIVRCSVDVFIYRCRTALVRSVTTQEKILKNRPVPGRLLNSPVMCTPLKSYDVSFICDHSIRNVSGNLGYIVYEIALSRWSLRTLSNQNWPNLLRLSQDRIVDEIVSKYKLCTVFLNE